MESLCDNLIIDIFQFVHPDDRFRFIMSGKKCYDTISNYITSPEWIYDQIDQFIKNHVVVNFSLRCNGPEEYHKYMRKHERDKRDRQRCDVIPPTEFASIAEFDDTGKCISAHDTGCGRECHVVSNKLAQQLGIDVMKCSYNDDDEVDNCRTCYSCWVSNTLTANSWNLNSVRNAPPNYLSFSDCQYRKYVTNSIAGQPSIKYYVYWSDGDNHARSMTIVGYDEITEYADWGTCLNGSLMPIHSVYESIGIIVHNMTGIEQIHKNLLDYDITHLQLFYVVDFLASCKIPSMIDGSWGKQNIGALRYSLFVEHVLRARIRKNIEMLMMMNRTRTPKYVFMIHPEIELKAAEVLKNIILFGAK